MNDFGERFTGRAKRAILRAGQLAEDRSQRPIATLHLLAGLLDDEDSIALEALARAGPDVAALRQAIREAVPSEAGHKAGAYSAAAHDALLHAMSAAERAEVNYAGTEHVLMGILEQQSSDAARVMATVGFSHRLVFAAVNELLSDTGGTLSELLRGMAAALPRTSATPAQGPLFGAGAPCQLCGAKPATVHITEIKDGEMREVHFCEKCVDDPPRFH